MCLSFIHPLTATSGRTVELLRRLWSSGGTSAAHMARHSALLTDDEQVMSGDEQVLNVSTL